MTDQNMNDKRLVQDDVERQNAVYRRGVIAAILFILVLGAVIAFVYHTNKSEPVVEAPVTSTMQQAPAPATATEVPATTPVDTTTPQAPATDVTTSPPVDATNNSTDSTVTPGTDTSTNSVDTINNQGTVNDTTTPTQ